MKIQVWCCQRLSASWQSQRRTVDAETVSVTRRAASSAASSRHDQRASGVPVWAGSCRVWALRGVGDVLRAGSSAAGSGRVQRARVIRVWAGSWQARALALVACAGGEAGRAFAAFAVGPGRQATAGEPVPSGAQGVRVCGVL
ncbi:hypothetical protein DZF91_06330 [Actinomadura logoneensis]|uniref:Uncharacterized protein n=1 Tax=Actinomadura logoneensis TaxID=2293572 RepID=A0A372JRW5_9ACTN|nr:hypothetical protein DZF91_06330 [Actinomadura logoneensis]